MNTHKVVCNTCEKGFEGETQEAVYGMARLHEKERRSDDLAHNSFKYVHLVTYTLEVGQK